MKTIVFSLTVFSILFFGCKNPNQDAENEITQDNVTLEKSAENLASSELNINRQVADTIDGGMMLLGPINEEGLNQEPYSVWFEENSKAYTPDMALVEQIKPLIKTCYIKVFMGSWCEDSQREIPALFKLLKLTE
ncbi:MAG TPA: hypothetical protein DCZ44_00775, partial [Flavobacteriaceae bacterium]|nr:hypothetical protein [Flavobacteriaceae bacterium]